MVAKRPQQRGFALFLTLVFSTLLAMLVTATVFSGRAGSVFTQDYHAKRSATYAAETGLSILQQRFQDRPDYGDSVDEPTPFGTGRFRYQFGADACINNLEGTTPVAGPYGDIPPGSAFVRVEGEAFGHREVVECLLGRRDTDIITAAVEASGKIHLEGNVTISGLESNELLSSTPADIVSNYDRSNWTGNPPLHYQQGSNPAAVLRVEGAVRSASPNSAAISQRLKDEAAQAVTDQARVPLRNIDIRQIVNEKSSLPSPVNSRVPGPGSFHVGGDHVISGALVLENTELYVDGDLTVVGSISGRGSVYVTGNTRFSGDSLVQSSDDGVALYGEGNVSLTGFNGSEFMDIVTSSAGPQFQRKWDQTVHNLHRLSEIATSGDNSPYLVPNPTHNRAWLNDVGYYINILSNNTDRSTVTHPEFGANFEDNTLLDLGDLVAGQPASPARDFMRDKFRALRWGPNSHSGGTVNLPGAFGIDYARHSVERIRNVRNFVENGEITDGVFNFMAWLKTLRVNNVPVAQYNDLSNAELDRGLRKMGTWLTNFDYDKLGSSYFQGSIYTRGAFYASNQVTIIGSVAAVADPSRSPSIFRPQPGVQLQSGDLYFGNGTSITFVSDLAPGLTNAGPRVGVSYWFR